MDDFWAGRPVLVTGAGGFVGGHLAAALVARGARVVALLHDARPRLALDLLGAGDRVVRVHGSVDDRGLLERVLAGYGIDTVVHLAAQAIVGAAARGPLPTLEANVRGTYLLLEACRQAPSVRRVAVASSDKAYGRQPELPYREDSPLLGEGPYDASKVCTDVLTRMYARSFGLPAAVARCANLYGPADLHPSRLVPELCRAVLRGERPRIRSDGSPTRDYLYIDDAVRAYLLLAEHGAEDGLRGEAINFGTGREVSVRELVETLLHVAGSTLEPAIEGTARGEIDRQVLASERAAQLLGWRAEIPLEEGLRRTVAWWRALEANHGGA